MPALREAKMSRTEEMAYYRWLAEMREKVIVGLGLTGPVADLLRSSEQRVTLQSKGHSGPSQASDCAGSPIAQSR